MIMNRYSDMLRPHPAGGFRHGHASAESKYLVKAWGSGPYLRPIYDEEILTNDS